MLRRRWWTQCAERFGVTYSELRFTASATASADEVAAVLRKAFTIVSPDSNEVPLSRYVTAVDDLVKRSAAGVREAFATQGVLHHATQIRRVLRLDATNDTVSLDTNANAKHFRNFLRAMARVPDVGVSRQTLKDWLPSMTEGEFDTALKSSFAAWLRLQPGDLIVPVLPISGTDPVARAVMRALMAAPDGGLSLAAITSAVMTATDTSPDVATVRSLLPVDWHVSMGPDAVSFCDWVSVMTRVHHRLPAEGVTLNNLIRYVQTEQHWPAAVVLHDVINANFLRTRFPDLFLVRTAASDGTSIIVVPRNAMDAERGTASSLLKLLLADPVDFGPPNVPYAHGWRNTESAFGAIEKIGIRPQTGGAADWVQLVREHAHFEAQIVVSIRLRAERCRAAVFVAVTESGLPVDTVDAILQKSGLLSNSNTVEASRVALRTASQPAHNSNDVVSPSWLETEFILAAQLTDLTQRVASGTSLPVDHVIVVCGAAQKDLLASVLRDVGTSFKKLTVVTPDGVHPVEQAAPSSE